MVFEAAGQREQYSPSISESLYAEWNGRKFVSVLNPENDLPDAAERVYRDFRAYVFGQDFSCIGAKAAFNGSLFRIALYNKMNEPETSASLGRDLRIFADEQRRLGSDYASFAAVFDAAAMDDEKMWEDSLWKQLENLHLLDPSPLWDPSVGSDPEKADFSFSFAGTGFFIVGLHPQSSRYTRRFSRAALVFNPHAQFDRLRETDRYERMQKTIRAREMKLQGSLNPNLSDFGTDSEARQYSGRAVEKDWKCPFHALFGKSRNTE